MNLMTRSFASESSVLLITRLVLGIVFIAHGGQKVFGWFGGGGLSGTVQFFEGMQIPGVLAYLTAFTEFFGGIFVLIGLLTRIFSAGIAIVMVVAMLKVHLPAFFNPAGIEFPLALFTLAISIFLLGPGVYSADNYFFNKPKD